MPKLNQHQSGFTFVELAVVLAITAIIVAVGIPSFGKFMEGARMSSTTNDYVYSLHKARSEAVKRVTGVALCVSNTSMDADASCASGESYGAGWLVYADENNNREFDDGEEILHRMEARTNGFEFKPTDVFEEQVYFNSSGNIVNPIDVPLSGQVSITYAGGGIGRTVILSANGRVAVEEQ